MKKLLAIILVLLLALMAGCGQSGAAGSAAGLYVCTGGVDENGEDMGSMLDMLASFGMFFTMELRDDGTGTLDMAGDSSELRWTRSTITVEDGRSPYTLEGDTLTLLEGDQSLVFTRVSEEQLEGMRNGTVSLSGEETPNDNANMTPGMYYATDCTQNGEPSYLSDEYLRIESDGSGAFGLLGDEYELRWTLIGDEFSFSDEEGDGFVGSYDGAVIEGDYFDGYHYVFERMEQPPEDFGAATLYVQKVGTYELVSVVDETEGDLTAAIDGDITLELRSDGTGTLHGSFDDGSDALELEWDNSILLAEDEAVPYTFEDGTLTFSSDGVTMVFAMVED